MKLDSKTIIIVIIVAVVAFLLWKKSKGAGGGSSVDAVSDDTGSGNNTVSSAGGKTMKTTVVSVTPKTTVVGTTPKTSVVGIQTGSSVVNGHTGSGASSLDYILSHVSFTKAERVKILTLSEACERSNTTRQSIEAKAAKTGYTFAQQLVLNAIWELYTKNGVWIAGPDGKKSYGLNLCKKVMKL